MFLTVFDCSLDIQRWSSYQIKGGMVCNFPIPPSLLYEGGGVGTYGSLCKPHLVGCVVDCIERDDH